MINAQTTWVCNLSPFYQNRCPKNSECDFSNQSIYSNHENIIENNNTNEKLKKILVYDCFKNANCYYYISERSSWQSEKQQTSICKCITEHHFIDKQQMECKTIIGSPCHENGTLKESNLRCNQVPNAKCINGYCNKITNNYNVMFTNNYNVMFAVNCNETHFHSNNECILKKAINENCSKTYECTSNLKCIVFSSESTCQCSQNYTYDISDNKCIATSKTVWDVMAKAGGFVIIIILIFFFVCRKNEEEERSGSQRGRQHSSSCVSRLARRRSSSFGSHRPLTQTSSNASRSSAYRTFEEHNNASRSIVIPMPSDLTRSLSSLNENQQLSYNPYQFDSFFPQQSESDQPPPYHAVAK